MQLIKCIASKPGLFDNVTLNFSNKVNIIYGKNGSGKSLLAKGLIETIWGKFTKKNLLWDDAWNSIYLEVLFQIPPESKYQIRNNKNKYYTIHHLNNFDEKIIYSENSPENSDKVILDKSKIKENTILYNFFDKIELESYLNTSFIPSVSDIGKEILLNYSNIKHIILGDNSNYYDIHNNLQNSFVDENISGNKLISEILNYEDQIKKLDKKLKIIEIENLKIEKIDKEKDNLKKEISKLLKKEKSLTKHIVILNKVYDDLKKINELNENLDHIKSVVQTEQEKMRSISILDDEIDKLFPQFKDLKLTDHISQEELQELFIKIRNLNERIDKYHSRRNKKRGITNVIAFSIIFSAIIIDLSILIKNKFLYQKDLLLMVSILGVSFIFAIIVKLYYLLSRKKGSIRSLDAEKEQLEIHLKGILEKSNIQLQDYKLSEIYEFLLQYFEDYIEYKERIKDLEKLKKSTDDGQKLKNIEEQLDSFKIEEESIKDEIQNNLEALELYKDIELDTEKIQNLISNLESEIEDITNEIKTKEKISSQIETELNQTVEDNNTIETILSEKAEIENKLKELSRKQKTVNFIMDNLSDAVQTREKEQLQKLISSTRNIFNYMTENQHLYEIDEEVIFDIITKNKIPVDLNPTMVHALLLSIKFSLSDFLNNSRFNLPLIIDDPFQYMDQERIERFKNLIIDISKKRQILIFTHENGKNNWGKYIEL